METKQELILKSFGGSPIRRPQRKVWNHFDWHIGDKLSTLNGMIGNPADSIYEVANQRTGKIRFFA